MAESYSVKAILSAADKGFTSTMKAASNYVGNLKSTLTSGLGFGIAAAAGAKAFDAIGSGVTGLIGDMNEAGAAWKTFQGNMEMNGKTKKQIKSIKGELQDFAEATIYSSSDMATTFAQLDAVGTKNTTNLVKGFGGLAAAAENPTQAMKTLSQQATQMAAKPKVAWEDFKLMLEQTPAGIAAVAKEMGMSTREMIKNVQDGKIKTDEFFDAIAKVGTNKAFTKLATEYKTVGQAMDGLQETMSNKLQPAFDALSTVGISAISKLVDKVGELDGEKIAAKLTNAVNQITDAFNSGGVQEAIATLFTMIYTQLSSSIPQIAEYGYQMILQLSQGFSTGFPEILSKVLSFIQGLGENIAAAAPVFIQRGFEILSNFVQGFVNALPILISQVPVVISTFANIINDNFPTILAKGAELLGQLVLGILKAIPTLVANIPKIVTAIVDVIEAFNWMNLGKNIIKLFVNGIKGMIGFVKTAGKGVYDAVHNAIKNLPTLLRDIGRTAMTGFSNVIKTAKVAVSNAAKTVGDGIINILKKLPSQVVSIGKNLIKGLWNGISDMTGWIIDKIGGFASSVVDSICSFFGINSPSRVMRDEVGRYLAEGIGVGFDKYMPAKSMQSSLQEALDAVGSTKIHDISIPNISAPSFDLAYSTSGGTMDLNDDYDYNRKVYVYIEVPLGIDGREFAKATAEYTEEELDKRQARDDRKHGRR